MAKDIVRDPNFEEMTEVKVDAKNRVSLGKIASGKVSSYKIYRNSYGQMILDPQVTVPAHEAWLFQNPVAAQRVKEGLEDAKKGRLVKAKEDYSKYLGKDK